MFKGFYSLTTFDNYHLVIIPNLLILFIIICQNFQVHVLCQGQEIDEIGTTTTTATTTTSSSSLLIDGVVNKLAIALPQLKKVKLILSPVNVHWGESYVSTGVNLNIYAKLNWIPEPEEVLKFEWLSKDGLIDSNSQDQSITHMFQAPDEQQFIRVNVYRSHKTDVNSSSALVLIGFDEIKLIVKAPVIVTNLEGKLFLEHGELLNIKLILNGTGPFYYCHKFCPDYYLSSLTNNNNNYCDQCFAYHEINDTQLALSHYLHYVGNYTLLFRVNNIINEEIKHYMIKINDTIREQTLPFAPIVSSILAVLILTTGVALHLRLRKRAYISETADFDFIHPNQGQEEEEWQEELSFIQRVRYILCRSNGDDDDDYLGERQPLTTNNHNNNNNYHKPPIQFK